MSNKNLHGVYAITEPNLHTDRAAMIEACKEAIAGGINVLQYRDKTATATEAFRTAKELQKLCADAGVTFIVNDDIVLAVAIKADGVHLGQHDADPQRARDALGEDAVIGVTCHHQIALAEAAIEEGADYVAFGRFFASQTKPDAPAAPLSVLTEAQALQKPVIAIGGITLDNAQQVIDAGAHCIAVANAIFAQDNIQQTAEQFARLFQSTN